MSSLVYPAARRYYQVMPFHRSVVLQSALCSIPPALVLFTGRLELSVIVMFAALLPLLGLHVLRKDPLMYSALMVGSMPMLLSLRGYLGGTYTLPIPLLGLGIGLWIHLRPREAYLLLRRKFAVVLLGLSVLYWIASFYATGDYASNMRAMELSFAALNVFVLGRHRAYLGSALLGMTLSAGCWAVAAFPLSERLGQFELNGETVGSPQAFGAFVTLILVLTFVDGGRWLLFVRRRPGLRWIIRIGATVAMLLSTSRSAWAVAVAVIGLVYVYDNRRRLEITSLLGVMAVTGIVLVGVGFGGTFEKYLIRTFSMDQSIEKITTGRSDQWEAIPAVIRDSPVWGFGPGWGREIATEYAGRNLIWHALYLQIVAELGLVGLAVVIVLLGFLLARCIRYAQVTGELLPLVGAVGFVLIGMVVPGLDGASACYLGLALISFDFSRWRILRTGVASGTPSGGPVTATDSARPAMRVSGSARRRRTP